MLWGGPDELTVGCGPGAARPLGRGMVSCWMPPPGIELLPKVRVSVKARGGAAGEGYGNVTCRIGVWVSLRVSFKVSLRVSFQVR